MQLTVPSKCPIHQQNSLTNIVQLCDFVYPYDTLPNLGIHSKRLLVMQENFVVRS